MAALHDCANCRTATTNDNWLCEMCLSAAANAQAALPGKLGRQPNFAEMDEARHGALMARFNEVHGASR